jgi:hypothetical protein
MINMSFRRLSSPLAFALASLATGMASGFVAAHDLTPNGYGPGGAAPAAYRPEAASPQEAQPTSYDDCAGCSDRDRGYHWAALQRIASITECPDDSWDFRRGCNAYMRDTGGV